MSFRSTLHPPVKALLGAAAAVLVVATPARAQVREIDPKLKTGTSNPIVPPPTLTATGNAQAIILAFPAVAGASGYRITRTNNAGDPETAIYEGPVADPSVPGEFCAAPRSCAYLDTQVKRNYLYSYRVYSVFPNLTGSPFISAPGPVASAQLTIARLR
jgi:hypothetical protein